MVQQLYNIFDSFQKIDKANRQYASAHAQGELPENRIDASTRAALSAAKLRAGEQGLSDEEQAMRQGQLADMEVGLGFQTDYGQLYDAYDKAGIDPGATGQNVSQGVATASALAGKRYIGSKEHNYAVFDQQYDRAMQNTMALQDMGMSGGASSIGEEGSDMVSGGNFQDVGGSPNVIDNNYGMSAPDYSGVYGGQTIDNNFGMSQPQQAGIPDYLSQQTPEVSSMNQQDIVSMLLKLLQTKQIPRA